MCRLSEDWKSSSKDSDCWCRALRHEVVLTPENLWLTESERSPRARNSSNPGSEGGTALIQQHRAQEDSGVNLHQAN